MRIDAHQHFWRPERGDYGWLTQAPAALQRAFLPAELRPQLAAAGVDATVLVQAAPSVAETHYLLGIADACPWVAGVVGWIDFDDAAQRGALERLAAHPRLVGLRPMVQDIADERWVASARLRWAFDAMQETGLCFDALGFAVHAPHFLAVADRHPALRMVLDHGLKPAIRRGDLVGWSQGLRALAERPQVFCKLSGLPTEAGDRADAESLRPVVAHLLACFGPERLMWGSDWPVLSASMPYAAWLALCASLLDGCDAAARGAIFGGTAARFYGLDPAAMEMPE